VVGRAYLVAHGAGEREGGRVRRKEQHPLKVGGADVAVGAAGAHHPGIGLTQDGQLVDVGVVVFADGRVAGSVTAAARGRGRRRCVVAVVLVGGHGGRHLLLRVLTRRLLLGHGTPDAQRMVAWQQHRVYEKLFARRTPQLLLHAIGRMSVTRLNRLDHVPFAPHPPIGRGPRLYRSCEKTGEVEDRVQSTAEWERKALEQGERKFYSPCAGARGVLLKSLKSHAEDNTYFPNKYNI